MNKEYYDKCVSQGINLYWVTLSKARGLKLVEEKDCKYVLSEDGKGPERIFDVCLEADCKYRLFEMVAYIRAKRMPDSFLLSSASKPENLPEILSNMGFDIDTTGLCMVLDLDQHVFAPGYSNELKIVKVNNESELENWTKVVNCALFGCEFFSFEQYHDIYDLENTILYLAYCNGVPVSTCMTINDGTAVLEMVATMPEYRKKGIATATIEKALYDLKERGIQTVSLRAEPDGINVYKKIGFVEHCKRVVASCNRDLVHKKTRPCRMEKSKVDQGELIFKQSSGIISFVNEMQKNNVIGQRIWCSDDEKTIYLTKRYACDCGEGCPENNSLIGQRCFCNYVNTRNEILPISYCNCCAEFYRPMFTPVFGEDVLIEPVETVLSGGEECIFSMKSNRINL